MVVKKIVIIHDENYTKAQILDELRQEGFLHKYKFINEVDTSLVGLYMDECDELWTFGHVKDMLEYKVALALGADIWQMG